METVGVEDDRQAETRSLRGLRGFISVGGTLGGTLLHFKILRKEHSPCAFPLSINFYVVTNTSVFLLRLLSVPNVPKIELCHLEV